MADCVRPYREESSPAHFAQFLRCHTTSSSIPFTCPSPLPNPANALLTLRRLCLPQEAPDPVENCMSACRRRLLPCNPSAMSCAVRVLVFQVRGINLPVIVLPGNRQFQATRRKDARMEKNGFQLVPPISVGLIQISGTYKDGSRNTVPLEHRESDFEVI